RAIGPNPNLAAADLLPRDRYRILNGKRSDDPGTAWGVALVDGGLVVVYLVVVFGLVFEFLNGFHDSANAIATVVATRVLRPGVAVLMAGALNLLGALSGTAVATTLGKGIVDPQVVTQTTVVMALVSASI